MFRDNGRGLRFSLSIVDNNKTRIACKDKHIIVDMPIEEVSKCWYAWQMRGDFVQHAFPKLNVDEREFLISGVTAEEWDAIFDKYKEK